MALSQSDLLRLMESLRTADGMELIRALAQRILQELIEAEATARIGAEPGERTEWSHHLAQRPPREDSDHAGRRPGPGHPQGPHRQLLLACSSAGAASTRPSTRSSWRPTSWACPPARSTTWSKPSARTPASQRARSPGSARIWTSSSPPSGTGPWTTPASPASISTPPTARQGQTTRSSPAPWSSPPGSPRTAAARRTAPAGLDHQPAPATRNRPADRHRRPRHRSRAPLSRMGHPAPRRNRPRPAHPVGGLPGRRVHRRRRLGRGRTQSRRRGLAARAPARRPHPQPPTGRHQARHHPHPRGPDRGPRPPPDRRRRREGGTGAPGPCMTGRQVS